MMDEIGVAIKGTGDKNPIGVAECLVNWDKNIKKWGFGHVDDPEAISRDLVTSVIPKCHPLLIKLRKDKSASWAKCGHAHGGFIRRAVKQSSPAGSTVTLYSVYPITAKHNLRRVSDETRGRFLPTEANLTVDDNEIDKIAWEDLGWTPNEGDYFDLRQDMDARPAICEFGFDVGVAPYIDDAENPSCAARVSFDIIRKEDFKLEKGMKVGMAVFFTGQTRPTRNAIVGADGTKIPPDFSEDDIKRYFGQPDRVNIYTGEIKYVGSKHIEYSINSFTGCSGAIVFLLDKDQPDSVDQNDWGKAVAIHSGAHPLLHDRNYGFLINEHPVFENL